MLPRILIVIVLLLLLIGMANSRRLLRIDLTAYGLFLGAFYFLFVPALLFLFTGTLSIPLLARIDMADQDANLAILIAYLLGLGAIFLISGIVKSRMRPRPEQKKQLVLSAEWMIYVVSILAYFALSIFILRASGVTSGGHWYLAKADYLEAAGTLGVISLYSIWGLRLLIVSFTFELLSRKTISYTFALVVTTAVCLYELLYVGNRIVVLMFGMAGLMYIFVQHGRRALVLTLLAILPLALGLAVYQDVRYMLFSATPLRMLEAIFNILGGRHSAFSDVFTSSFLKVFEHADFVVMLNVFGMAGSTLELLNGSTLLKTIVWFIPRSLWPGKPESITVVVGQLFLPGSRVSLVPLVFGEFHLNFGILGILFFPFFLFLVLSLIKAVTRRIPLHNYLNFLAGFLLFRLPISDILIAVIMAALIYQGFGFAVRRIWRPVPYEPLPRYALKKQTS